jgi:hypothetical protein
LRFEFEFNISSSWKFDTYDKCKLELDPEPAGEPGAEVGTVRCEVLAREYDCIY